MGERLFLDAEEVTTPNFHVEFEVFASVKCLVRQLVDAHPHFQRAEEFTKTIHPGTAEENFRARFALAKTAGIYKLYYATATQWAGGDA